MSEQTRFTVRPFSRPARSDLKDSLRVNLSAAALLALKLHAGDQCILQQDGKPDRPAVAWQAVEKIQDTVVQISKTLQDLYGLKLGDKISIAVGGSVVQDAQRIEVREVLQNENESSIDDQLSDGDRPHWEWLLQDPISKAENLAYGLRFDSVQGRGQKRGFICFKHQNRHSESGRSTCSRRNFRESEPARSEQPSHWRSSETIGTDQSPLAQV